MILDSIKVDSPDHADSVPMQIETQRVSFPIHHFD